MKFREHKVEVKFHPEFEGEGRERQCVGGVVEGYFKCNPRFLPIALIIIRERLPYEVDYVGGAVIVREQVYSQPDAIEVEAEMREDLTRFATAIDLAFEIMDLHEKVKKDPAKYEGGWIPPYFPPKEPKNAS